MRVDLPLLRIFDRMGHGGLVLSTGGQVLALNACAQRLLCEMLGVDEAEVETLNGTGRAAVKTLLGQSRARVQFDSETWMLVERDDKRPLIMNAVPLEGADGEGAHTVLLMIDLERPPVPNPIALEQIFGLTPAEAKLATLLAQGATLAAAARSQGVCVATVRAHLRSIFGKTQTHRQAELVMLVSRLSTLP